MAIYVPGKRDRRGVRSGTKRNVVAVLQLTAMVDMFTVLVVFLLQNYASTNQILPISEQIDLPEATLVKELKPSFVVVLSKTQLSFNEKQVTSFDTVDRSQSWLIEDLFHVVKSEIEKIAGQQQKNSGEIGDTSSSENEKVKAQYKMTLQVDKDIKFLPVKKVLYTLTHAGVQEINFAVIKVSEKDKYHIL